MITREQIIESAGKYRGIRYLHQGRNKNGVDCTGFFILVLKDLGYPYEDVSAYGRMPNAEMLLKALRATCEEIPVEEVQKGDVFLMKLGTQKALHTAIHFGTDKFGNEVLISALHPCVQVKKIADFPREWFKRGFSLCR